MVGSSSSWAHVCGKAGYGNRRWKKMGENGEADTDEVAAWCEHMDVRLGLNETLGQIREPSASHTCRMWSSASTTRKCVLLCGVW